jgi:hypothetical protein
MAFLVLLCIGMRRTHARESLVWIVRLHGQAAFLLENLERNQVEGTVLALAIPPVR